MEYGVLPPPPSRYFYLPERRIINLFHTTDFAFAPNPRFLTVYIAIYEILYGSRAPMIARIPL